MGMTLATAEVVSTWANWILLASLLVGVAATYFVVVTADIKESALKQSISSNEVETARAKEEASKAQLELAKFKARRTDALTEEVLQKIVARLKPFAGSKFDAGIPVGNEECRLLLMVVENVLHAAGFDQLAWQDPRGSIGLNRGDRPFVGGITARGLIIEVDAKKNPELWKVAQEIASAFNDAGITSLATADVVTKSTNESLHVLIGEKPQ